jgi:hypothetical protein
MKRLDFRGPAALQMRTETPPFWCVDSAAAGRTFKRTWWLMACSECTDPWQVYLHTNAIAINIERHSALYRCRCGRQFEVFPKARTTPQEITEAEAKALFLGVG